MVLENSSSDSEPSDTVLENSSSDSEPSDTVFENSSLKLNDF
jgi:hypothetical protein